MEVWDVIASITLKKVENIYSCVKISLRIIQEKKKVQKYVLKQSFAAVLYIVWICNFLRKLIILYKT
jgi:hypothetical protein